VTVHLLLIVTFVVTIADLSLNAKAENIILNPTNTETTIRMSKFAGNMNKPM